MKKLFALAVVLALVFAACDNADYSNKFGEIGKTGPGGGFIFYAEGGQYKECSGELGNRTWDDAVTTAKNYKGGGFNNWHLPDRGELDLMYKNLKKNGLGNFSNNEYWSSVGKYYQNFRNGSTDYVMNDFYTCSVRAVRSYDKESVTPTVNTILKIKNESSTDITEVIWQGVSFAESTTVNSIKKGTTVIKTVQPGTGYIYFKRSTNAINARTRDLVVIAKDEQKEFTFLDNTVIVDVDNPNNTGTLGSLQPILTTLKIKNESLAEITDVIWQDVPFRNNQYENSIKPGTTVTASVNAGGGYIFFKRKSNPITARTNDMIIIEKYQEKEFSFTDSMLIVEINNTNNIGTLHDLPSTVVFWDDAEGEMQQYYSRQGFVVYYKDNTDLLDPKLHNNIYTPKNGNKSIAVGYYYTALLHLKINLEKNARLSFWYANKYVKSPGTAFSINGVQKTNWNTDINWSFMTFDLEPGENNIIWEKKDGQSEYDPYNLYYLSLDDILIYYTE